MPRKPKTEEPEPKQIIIPASAEEQLRAQIDDLYRQSLSGNMPAKRLWLEMQQEADARRAFDVHVSIVPYDIADRSLAKIVSAADISVVVEMLSGLSSRMEHDQTPGRIRELLDRFKVEYEQWFNVVFGVKDQ